MKCPSCNHDNLKGAPYCDVCGAVLGSKPPAVAPPGPGSAHEKRRTVLDAGPAAPPPKPAGAAWEADPLPPPRPPFDPADPFGRAASAPRVAEAPRPAWGAPAPTPQRKNATIIDRPLGANGGPRVRGALVEYRGPDDAGRIHPLRAGRNTIGRDASCDVVLGDGRVSGQHAILFVRAEDATLVDISRNGTMVDGRLLVEGDQLALGHGASLQVGEAQFLLLLAGEDQLPRWEPA